MRGVKNQFQILSRRQDQDRFVIQTTQYAFGRLFHKTDPKAYSTIGKSLRTNKHGLLQAENIRTAFSSRYEIERQDPYLKIPRHFVESLPAQRTRAVLNGKENIILTVLLALAAEASDDVFEARPRDLAPYIHNFKSRSTRGIREAITVAVSAATEHGLGIFRITSSSRQTVRIQKCLAYFAALQSCRHYSRISLADVPKARGKYAQRLYYRAAFRANYDVAFIRPLTLSIDTLRRTLGCTGTHAANTAFLRRVVAPTVEEISDADVSFFLILKARYERKEGERGRAKMAGFRIGIEKLEEEPQRLKEIRKRIVKFSTDDIARVRHALTQLRKFWERGEMPADNERFLPDYRAAIRAMHACESADMHFAHVLSAYTLILQNALTRRYPERVDIPRPSADDYYGSAILDDVMHGKTGAEIFEEWYMTAQHTGWIRDLIGITPSAPFPPTPAQQIRASKRRGYEIKQARLQAT